MFACISDSKLIPFKQVNDDYCDCSDGSDEPGTSACPNAKFHCMNRGFQAIDIPSSRVNDQICDCCDGSDEWDGAIDCSNVCDELGLKYREEFRQKTLLVKKGYAKRQILAAEGNTLISEKRVILDGLKAKKEAIMEMKNAAEAKKNAAEEIERDAKKKHTDAWEEVKKAKKRLKAQELFTKLDVSGDLIVDIAELKSFEEFSSDNSSVNSDDELKAYFDGKDECDFEQFVDVVYDKISHVFAKEEVGVDETKEILETEDESFDEKEINEEHEQLMEKDETKLELKKNDSNEEENMEPYSVETENIIKAADDAREEYNKIYDQYLNNEKGIDEAEAFASGDFGVDMSWAPLKDKCFSLDVNQYTYKLCVFNQAEQKEKNGQLTINLGRWSGWIDDGKNKFDAQKYDKGLGCWNGPERSTKVVMKCGEETALVEATEPSKCEYLFVLQSPAACPDPKTFENIHQEL